MRSPLLVAVLAGSLAIPALAQEPAAKPIFKLQQVMVPMRDGVKLQTAILTPVDQQGSLPILFRRTPYGVPEKPPGEMPASWKELAQDGYIFVIQNLRGRFKSEGVFDLTSGGPHQPEVHERDDGCLRQHRVAAQKCAEQHR